MGRASARPAVAQAKAVSRTVSVHAVLCGSSARHLNWLGQKRLLLGADRHAPRPAPFWLLRVQLEVEVEQLLEKIPGDAGAIVERDRFFSNHQRGVDEARVGESRGVLKIGMQRVCLHDACAES